MSRRPDGAFLSYKFHPGCCDRRGWSRISCIASVDPHMHSSPCFPPVLVVSLPAQPADRPPRKRSSLRLQITLPVSPRQWHSPAPGAAIATLRHKRANPPPAVLSRTPHPSYSSEKAGQHTT